MRKRFQILFLSLITILSYVGLADAQPSLTIISPQAILEPSANKPSDKDGYPPLTSSADPEEGSMSVELVVTAPISNPSIELIDYKYDKVDDLTIDGDNPRDLDYLDGVIDNQLAAGTYYLHWNLEKSGIAIPTNTAGYSITNDVEKFQAALYSETSLIATSPVFTVTMEGSASIKQNDLRWLETAPGMITASIGESFVIYTKYSHMSAGALDVMILQSYYNGTAIRLDRTDLYYYNTDGKRDIGSIADGPPSNWDYLYTNWPTLLYKDQPSTLSSGDNWVGAFYFTVIGQGGSRFIPYFQTKPSPTSNWKIDTGYEGFQVEPPSAINPPIFDIYKRFSTNYTNGVVSGPNPPLVGQTTTFEIEIEVTNTGYDNGVEVVVNDAIPSGVNFEGIVSTSHGTATYNSTTGELIWNIGNLLGKTSSPPNGESALLRFQVSVTPTAAQDGTNIQLNEGASGIGKGEEVYKDFPFGPTPPLWTGAVGVGTPAFSTIKTVDKIVANPGDNLTYTISYSNTGNSDATSVMIKDTLPNYTSFVSAEFGGTYDAATNTVTWNIGRVSKGTSGLVSFTVVIDSVMPSGTTTISNVAIISCAETPDVTTPPATTKVSASPVLTITKTDSPDPVEAGADLTYTLTIGNTGNAVANNVVVTETYDANTTFVSATPAPDAGTNNQWAIASLAAGESKTITVTVSVASPLDNGTTLTNVAQVVSDETPIPISDTEYTLVESDPDLSATKAANPTSGSSVAPGQTITYTINYANTGNMNATGVTISDVIDANLTNVTPLDGGTLTGNTITWDIGNVAAGASGSVSFTADVVSPCNNGTVINNTATLDSEQTEPTNTNTTTHTVSSAPVLTLTKTAVSTQTTKDVTNTGGITCSQGVADSGSVTTNEVSGTTIVYTLSYSNTGNMDATNVVITDEIPAGTTYVSNTGGGVYGSGAVTWNLGTVTAEASGSVTLTVSLGDAQ